MTNLIIPTGAQRPSYGGVSAGQGPIFRSELSLEEFARSERTGRAKLIATVYTLVPPPGMEFDEATVKQIRKTFDPGFIPFHRKMVFQSGTGGEIVLHNWGVCRYSEHGVRNELIAAAERPATGYFSTLEHPTDIDGIYPFGAGMDNDGLPPPYEPFNGPKVLDHCRRVYGIALEKYRQRTEERGKEKDSRIESLLDTAEQKFLDALPRSDWSTAVAPTPLKDQIKGDPTE